MSDLVPATMPAQGSGGMSANLGGGRGPVVPSAKNPVPVKVLGEHLVLFRDATGAPGLLAEHCSQLDIARFDRLQPFLVQARPRVARHEPADGEFDRVHDSQVHHRHQTLPACQHPRFTGVFAQQAHRLA